MSIKTDFLINAITEVQETNRFLDTKAGVLIAFETTLLAFIMGGLLDVSALESIREMAKQISPDYLIILIIFSLFYVLAVVAHILFTVRIFLASENPERHVRLGDYTPKRLFFLFQMDQENKIEPSLSKYQDKFQSMSERDVNIEYIYELMKLSYIRKIKNDRLNFSMRFLEFLIMGIILLGLLLIIGYFN